MEHSMKKVNCPVGNLYDKQSFILHQLGLCDFLVEYMQHSSPFYLCQTLLFIVSLFKSVSLCITFVQFLKPSINISKLHLTCCHIPDIALFRNMRCLQVCDTCFSKLKRIWKCIKLKTWLTADSYRLIQSALSTHLTDQFRTKVLFCGLCKCIYGQNGRI